MASVNDILYNFLGAIAGFEGGTLNDRLARLGNINYAIPPRTAADPVDPPLGATWTNTTEGRVKTMQAGGIEYVQTSPAP